MPKANVPDDPIRDRYDWLVKPSTDAAEVMRHYDEFAPAYDEVLLSRWGYRAPATAAELLARHIAPGSRVLDAGCGTGLTGSALRRVGFDTVHGADISAPSLQIAAGKGVYRSLVRADLLKPLPFPSGTFDAAICVGVLSYIAGDELFRELSRVTRKGGALLLTHRTDLIATRLFGDLLSRNEAEGLWSLRFESSELPYLPGHPDYADKIQVRYFVLSVR